jgi:hypothetical protein
MGRFFVCKKTMWAAKDLGFQLVAHIEDIHPVKQAFFSLMKKMHLTRNKSGALIIRIFCRWGHSLKGIWLIHPLDN